MQASALRPYAPGGMAVGGGEDMKESAGSPDPHSRPVGDWSDVADAGTDVTWGVGAVSDRIGVAASTLRTWERRYGVGPSHRTNGGHRRYTEHDIAAVELVRRMVARGVSAQDAARVARELDDDGLHSALAEEQPPHSALGSVDVLLAAATAGDDTGLDRLLSELVGTGHTLDAWRTVLSPALSRLARETSLGQVEPAVEARATTALLEHLERARGRHSSSQRPQVLLASGVADREALPFVALGAALRESEVSLRLLEPEVDVREALDLARRLRPELLFLWDQPVEITRTRHFQGQLSEIAVMHGSLGWPHEVSLRLGTQSTGIPTDVAGTLRHVLDRVA